MLELVMSETSLKRCKCNHWKFHSQREDKCLISHLMTRKRPGIPAANTREMSSIYSSMKIANKYKKFYSGREQSEKDPFIISSQTCLISGGTATVWDMTRNPSETLQGWRTNTSFSEICLPNNSNWQINFFLFYHIMFEIVPEWNLNVEKHKAQS